MNSLSKRSFVARRSVLSQKILVGKAIHLKEGDAMGWVLFFDGDCVFCSVVVRRIVRWDRRGKLAFSPLQGKLAAEKGLTSYGGTDGSMILLRESDGRLFVRSDALIELAGVLGGAWRFCSVFRLIPQFLRDALYGWVARHRHQFTVGKERCSLPDSALIQRLRE